MLEYFQKMFDNLRVGAKQAVSKSNRHAPDGNTIVRLEVYDLTNDTTLFSVTKSSASECVEAFENAPIWGGKNFWDIESQMQWVDE